MYYSLMQFAYRTLGDDGMSEAIEERRRSARYPLVVAAEVLEQPSGTKLSARASDISVKGCYIDTIYPIPTGSHVLVRLSREKQVFEAKGQVVYLSPGLGMGITFASTIPPEQLAILEGWLAELVPDSK
jgi:hypothetical protein